jgi:hypothetical protein
VVKKIMVDMTTEATGETTELPHKELVTVKEVNKLL